MSEIADGVHEEHEKWVRRKMETFFYGFASCAVMIGVLALYFWNSALPSMASTLQGRDEKPSSFTALEKPKLEETKQSKPLPEPFWVRRSELLRIASHEKPSMTEEDRLWEALKEWRQRPDVRREFCVAECRLSGGGHENLYLDVLVLKRPQSPSRPLTVGR